MMCCNVHFGTLLLFDVVKGVREAGMTLLKCETKAEGIRKDGSVH